MAKTDPSLLLVDDDDTDVMLLEMAAKRAGFDTKSFFRCKDGQEAVDYLNSLLAQDRSTGRQLPRLMLLDIKMPCMDGFEVLQWMRGHRDQLRLPVVMLSNSGQVEDQAKAIELGAAEYQTKPFEQPKYVRLLAELRQRYLA